MTAFHAGGDAIHQVQRAQAADGQLQTARDGSLHPADGLHVHSRSEAHFVEGARVVPHTASQVDARSHDRLLGLRADQASAYGLREHFDRLLLKNLQVKGKEANINS